MLREITVQIDPPVPRPGRGSIRKFVVPKWPVVPGQEAQAREEVAKMLVLEFGTGTLTGDFDTGLTYRPD